MAGTLPKEWTPGAQFAAGYTLVELIGSGTSKDVWRATQRVAGKPVREFAVALLRAATVRSGGAVAAAALERLRHEATVLAALNGCGAPELHKYPEPDDYYLMMQLPGDVQTVGQWLEALPRRDDRDRAAERCFRAIVRAVEQVHAQGWVHLDLKPDNLLVTERDDDAQVWVVDFGSARKGGQPIGDLETTPEYYPGLRARPDARAAFRMDVGALGRIWQKLVECGARVEGAQRELLTRVVSEDPRQWPETARALRRAFDHATRVGGSERPVAESADADNDVEAPGPVDDARAGLAVALGATPYRSEGAAGTTASPPRSERARSTAVPRRRASRPGILLGATLLGLTAFAAQRAWRASRARAASPPAPPSNRWRMEVPFALPPPQHLAVGRDHTCAVRDRAVWCWGSNRAGQLGRLASSEPVATPQRVQFRPRCQGCDEGGTAPRPLDNVVEIVAGSAHTCARRANGEVYCWGRGDVAIDHESAARDYESSRQNGREPSFLASTPASTFRRFSAWTRERRPGGLAPLVLTSLVDGTPTLIEGITATQLASSRDHACALTTEREVWCWGANGRGQIAPGESRTAPSVEPRAVAPLANARAILVGDGFTCARSDADGETRCVGWEGEALPARAARTALSRVLEVGRDARYVLAQTAAGEVEMAPADAAGARFDVLPDERGATLAVGWAAACAARAREVRCWAPGSDWHASFAVDEVIEIGLGEAHGCVLRRDGDVRCWGRNDSGQLGIGTFARDVPGRMPGLNGPPGPVIPIAGLRDVEQIAAGGNLTCARRSDGTVACWGSRYRAYPPQWLASGTDANNWAIDGGAVARDALSGWLRGGSPRHPYFIAHPVTSSSIVGALEIGVASGDLLVRNAAGVFRQEFPFDDVRENDLGYVTSVTARRAQYLGDGVGPLAADPRGPCVAQADGRLRCFPFDAAAMDLPGIDAVAQGVSDGRHACAVTNRGAVFCWGANRDGELGVGAATERPIAAPLRVPSLPPAESVALGESFSCVQLASGEVRCWGLYPHPVGDATTLPASGRLAPQPVVRTPWLVPVDVPGISTATQVVAGRRHACARLRDGRVVCWAASTEASPLLSTPDQMVRAAWLQLFGHLPHEVPLDDVLTLAAGEAHTCALRANHSVVCWGDNSHGQLGDGFVRHADTPASVRFPFW